jgi:hypothetical protein
MRLFRSNLSRRLLHRRNRECAGKIGAERGEEEEFEDATTSGERNATAAALDSIRAALNAAEKIELCFDCYRVERTSSRAGLTPAVDQRLFTAHGMIQVNVLSAS